MIQVEIEKNQPATPRRRRTQAEKDQYYWDRVKPHVDQSIRVALEGQEKSKRDYAAWISALVELIKVIRWLVLIPFPLVIEWIKHHVNKGGIDQ